MTSQSKGSDSSDAIEKMLDGEKDHSESHFVEPPAQLKVTSGYNFRKLAVFQISLSMVTMLVIFVLMKSFFERQESVDLEPLTKSVNELVNLKPVLNDVQSDIQSLDAKLDKLSEKIDGFKKLGDLSGKVEELEKNKTETSKTFQLFENELNVAQQSILALEDGVFQISNSVEQLISSKHDVSTDLPTSERNHDDGAYRYNFKNLKN